MKKVFFLVLALVVTSCSDKKEKEITYKLPASSDSLKSQLVGTWSNLTLHVEMKSDNGDSVLIIEKGEWESTLKIKPIETSFREDGTFISTYYTLDGEIMMTNEGVWYIEEDSVVLVQDNVATSYKASIEEDVATFKGYVDWDQDGEVDDYYQGTQGKMKTK